MLFVGRRVIQWQSSPRRCRRSANRMARVAAMAGSIGKMVARVGQNAVEALGKAAESKRHFETELARSRDWNRASTSAVRVDVLAADDNVAIGRLDHPL